MWKNAVRFLERQEPGMEDRLNGFVQMYRATRALVRAMASYYAAGDVMYIEMMVPTVAAREGSGEGVAALLAGECKW